MTEREKILTKGVILYAVLQFSTCILSFYILYKSHVDSLSNPVWRVLALVALAVSLLIAFAPAMLSASSKSIRTGKIRNPMYIVPIIPIVMLSGWTVLKTYFNWQFSASIEDVPNYLFVYIVVSIVFSLFIYFFEKEDN